MSMIYIYPDTPLLYSENGALRGKQFFLFAPKQIVDCGYIYNLCLDNKSCRRTA